MDKNKFVNYFKDKDNRRLEFYFSKMKLAENTGKDISIGEFVTADIYVALQRAAEAAGLQLLTWEFYEDCERKFCVIASNSNKIEFSIGILKIRNKSKFAELSHKDYLGAVMALDIKREKIGDLIVKDECCYMPVINELIPYIIANLQRIGNCPCEICELDIENVAFLGPEFKDSTVIVSSMRIDCVISEISGESRGKSLEYLQRGKVLINYSSESRKDRIVQVGDIITVRGIGKFKVAGILGKTQKDRLKLLISKFL